MARYFPIHRTIRLSRTERSRPFPTNLLKVHNRPVRFIDSLKHRFGGTFLHIRKIAIPLLTAHVSGCMLLVIQLDNYLNIKLAKGAKPNLWGTDSRRWQTLRAAGF